MSMHYLCWFSTGAVAEDGFLPADGGCEHESDQVAWEMSEILRDDCGIHLEAFVPVMPDLKNVDILQLPSPQRCQEVFSDALLESLRQTQRFAIRDIFKQPKDIQGSTVAEWLEGYRKRWKHGFFLVRLPDPGARA